MRRVEDLHDQRDRGGRRQDEVPRDGRLGEAGIPRAAARLAAAGRGSRPAEATSPALARSRRRRTHQSARRGRGSTRDAVRQSPASFVITPTAPGYRGPAGSFATMTVRPRPRPYVPAGAWCRSTRRATSGWWRPIWAHNQPHHASSRQGGRHHLGAGAVRCGSRSTESARAARPSRITAAAPRIIEPMTAVVCGTLMAWPWVNPIQT